MQGVSDNEISLRFGSKLRFYFSKGNYLREYINDAGYTIQKGMFLTQSNQFYFQYLISSPDTLYYSDASDSAFNKYSISDSIFAREKILDCNTVPVLIRQQYTPPGNQAPLNTVLIYYFCPELPVNPTWHKDIFIWNKVIAAHPFIATKFTEETTGYFRQTFIATRVEWKPLEDSFFKPDPKLVLNKTQSD
ncbi:MAG: hypothetical protein HZA79_12065 [Sphingobacteriales bacterium]|nr:hypothetical protein [Sphingobacteriales bacterium]